VWRWSSASIFLLALLPISAGAGKEAPNPFDAWVRITPDNRVTLILGKSEMGQGIMTALP